MKVLLQQYKNKLDYELKDLFLFNVKDLIKIKFFNYIIVYAPSSLESVKKRRFNHLIDMFEIIKLQKVDCLIKTKNIEQKKLSMKERQKMIDFVGCNSNINKIRNKNILLVDDLFTTGATIKGCIDLLKKYNPKSIKVFVLMKNENMAIK